VAVVPRLDAMAWPDVAPNASSTLLVVPLGATEQHGPHLPLATDTHVAVAVAERLARLRDDVLVAPALPYGSSGEHAAFPGTLSIGGPVLELVVVELVRSADAFAGVVLVSGHAGNAEALMAAVATLRSEGRRVVAWLPRLRGSDSHAGRTETSVMLSLRPGAVALSAAERGNTRPIEELLPLLREHGVAALSPTGVLGDPAGASASEGDAILDALAADLADSVGKVWP
jgi:mycofactocin system creatininase family protein